MNEYLRDRERNERIQEIWREKKERREKRVEREGRMREQESDQNSLKKEGKVS